MPFAEAPELLTFDQSEREPGSVATDPPTGSACASAPGRRTVTPDPGADQLHRPRWSTSTAPSAPG